MSPTPSPEVAVASRSTRWGDNDVISMVQVAQPAGSRSSTSGNGGLAKNLSKTFGDGDKAPVRNLMDIDMGRKAGRSGNKDVNRKEAAPEKEKPAAKANEKRRREEEESEEEEEEVDKTAARKHNKSDTSGSFALGYKIPRIGDNKSGKLAVDDKSSPKKLTPRFDQMLVMVQDPKCKEKHWMRFFAEMLFHLARYNKKSPSLDLVPTKGPRTCPKCLCPYLKKSHTKTECLAECCGRTRCRKCFHRHEPDPCECDCIQRWCNLVTEELAQRPDSHN